MNNLPPVTVVHEPNDIVTIEGVKYSGDFFRYMAFPDGEWFRVVKNEHGAIWIEKMQPQPMEVAA